jgi:hypothetical protein
MAVAVARDRQIKLTFYGTDGSVLILASWDEEEEEQHPALEAEVLAKYYALMAKAD